ncbi:MAG: TPM domain-containing protein [Paludibacter sp.]
MKKLLLIICCSFAGLAFSAEYTVQSIPNPIMTDAHAYVSNPDGILKSETVQKINFVLDSLKMNTGAEVAVVMLNSIGQAELNSFATELFTAWGIGKAKQDNGLLVLFVLDQRKVKFEVGYGLEGVLPDAICKRIQTQVMTPEFKKGNYDGGMLAGIQYVQSYIRQEPVNKEVAVAIAWDEILPFAIAAYLLLILFTWVWISNAIQKVQRNPKLISNIARYKAIKNEKSGILSLVAIMLPVVGFVAILFFSQPAFLLLLIPIPFTTIPGNIYGKLMMIKIRRKPIPCTVCDGKMHILSEKQEDVHLKLAQQFEEQLHAIDYDVFVCDKCDNQAIFSLDKPSAYSECPKCGTKAFILKEKRTLVAPTYITAGTERTIYHCKFCGHEENNNTNIPRLTRSSGALVGGAIAGGLFSGGGGFGGGSGGGGGMGVGFSGVQSGVGLVGVTAHEEVGGWGSLSPSRRAL